MARKQTPFELPARTRATCCGEPGIRAAALAANPAPAVNIEELTITELTKLLDDIERRMSRIKPHVLRELNAQLSLRRTEGL